MTMEKDQAGRLKLQHRFCVVTSAVSKSCRCSIPKGVGKVSLWDRPL